MLAPPISSTPLRFPVKVNVAPPLEKSGKSLPRHYSQGRSQVLGHHVVPVFETFPTNKQFRIGQHFQQAGQSPRPSPAFGSQKHAVLYQNNLIETLVLNRNSRPTRTRKIVDHFQVLDRRVTDQNLNRAIGKEVFCNRRIRLHFFVPSW
jgi:hypothetical protein